MVNHSCANNARWVFEGTELQIRAARDISAGQEITIGYASDGGDYIGRREAPRKGWHFDCTCELCQKGSIGPQGELNESPTHEDIEDYLGLIGEIKNAGFGLDSWPMCWLHAAVWVCHVRDANWEGALKMLLTKVFVIEPSKSSFADMEEKLDTLHQLINLLDIRKFEGVNKKAVGDVFGFLR
jgi:hypothetical protein